MLPVIPGLRYLPDYLDFETHARLWVAADLQPWRRAQERGIQIYGYSYHHTHGGGIYRIGDLPPWALDVATRLWRDGLMPDVPDQMVANDYEPGPGIFAHVDQAVLGATIVSISLGSSCVMQFTESNSGREEQLLLEPRSALVLSGEARSHWKHAIPARLSDVWMNHESARTRRVSLTFRKMLKASASPE
jgi:alkylated DNA repair dioxygenase AlkB